MSDLPQLSGTSAHDDSVPPDVVNVFVDGGRAIGAEDFIRTACDPSRSVVVEACAGSGKTWLLVSRMLRLLLAGAEPGEMLAITFTRKAAQEMRERLIALLRQLALEPDQNKVLKELTLRGLSAADARAALPLARNLYARVLASPHGLSVDTFHSWFIRLLQIAPLRSGVPHGYGLEENTAELREQAWLKFMQSLNRPGNDALREALMTVYDIAGDWSGREMIEAFVAKRAEWQIMKRASDPAERLRQGFRSPEDGERDARLAFWQDRALHERFLAFARAYAQGTAANKTKASAIEQRISQGSSIEDFEALCAECLTKESAPKILKTNKELIKNLGADAAQAAIDLWFELGAELLTYRERAHDLQVRRLNDAMFLIGEACIRRYQQIKEDRRKMDFADLELHAWHLLTHPEHTAYLHARIDARYRHVLIDEFQDTNPLQWHVVRAWLDAYGDDGDRPSVFIVGDPKQSIYRFRRAEPRVFRAARRMLCAMGAADLGTRQTRRNGRAIVDVLNQVMVGINPLYLPQDTLSDDAHSTVWRLPLVRPQRDAGADAVAADGDIEQDGWDGQGARADQGERGAQSEQGERGERGEQSGDSVQDAEGNEEGESHNVGLKLRDPLTEDPPDDEDSRREREGRQVGAALWAARERWQQRHPSEPPLKWSDMMILVRSRTHLRAYEAGWRAEHMPCTSSRAGGLLDALEVGDLIALLRWMTMPADDLALAQVLKSPIAQASDADLIALAADKDGSWWQRLQRRIAHGQASDALIAISGKLQVWQQAAQHLPVHDLLDLVLHDGGLLQAYAITTPGEMRARVLGNLEAFVALSLQLDAGRYPSIARFLDQVHRLRRGKEQEAPDEADVDASVDAVRIMTIHGAKGLEAQVVAIMDCNPSGGARDSAGVLCDWPEDQAAPTHFSVFGRKAERGHARKALFDKEDAFREQENLNLLYVAATRAKHLLIISGVHVGKADSSGLVADSWYARLQCVDEYTPEVRVHASPDADGHLLLTHFDPPSLPAVNRGDGEPDSGSDDNAATREGTLLHALMERLTQGAQWPVTVPAAATVARWLRCSFDEALTICAQAQCILSQPSLEPFFDPARYSFARNEMEVVHDGALKIMDRVVIVDGCLWILDYKRNLYASQRADYAQQLAQYRAACEQLFPGLPVMTALITSDGQLQQLDSTSGASLSHGKAGDLPERKAIES